MSSQTEAPHKGGSGRIVSIDIIRGLTILVMIFVNDLAGVANVPAWMKHATTFHDGMTFVDWVFPAFLFIVGMSIPFSVGRRIEKGDSLTAVWKHILVRVVGLLILGFYMVNADAISNHGIINPALWIILMYLFVIIIWNRNSQPNYLLSKKWIKYAAGLGLVALFFVFRGEGETGFIQMQPGWWGILGLIGWAYLVACLFYIPFRKNQLALLGGAALLFLFDMAVNAGMLKGYPFLQYVWPGFYIGYTLGSHPAIVVLGVVLGIEIRKHLDRSDHASIMKWSFGFGAFLFIAGVLLHQLNHIDTIFIISKNLATPPWCLVSSAFTVWIWMAIYWIVDMKGYSSWSRIIEPAGTNPLFAYILAPLAVELFALSAVLFNGFDVYSWLGNVFWIGFLRAFLIAFLMTWLPGYLGKKGLQLKL